jgi:hypothetical protein
LKNFLVSARQRTPQFLKCDGFSKSDWLIHSAARERNFLKEFKSRSIRPFSQRSYAWLASATLIASSSTALFAPNKEFKSHSRSILPEIHLVFAWLTFLTSATHNSLHRRLLSSLPSTQQVNQIKPRQAKPSQVMLPTTQSISKDTMGTSKRTPTKQPNQTFLTHRNVVVLVVLLVVGLVNLVVSHHLLPGYPYSSSAPESSTTVRPNIDLTAKEEPVNVSTTTTSPAITNGISTASTNGSVSTAAMTGLVRSSVITALANDTINAVVNPSPSSPPRLKVGVYGGSITVGNGVANRYTSILGLEMPELEVANRGKTKFTVPDAMLTQTIDDC